MDWLGIVDAGLVATAAMTVLMYGGVLVGMPKMDIAQFLGSFVLPQGRLAFAVGIVDHFLIGVGVAIIYGLVWEGLDIDVSWWTGLIFGAVHAVATAVAMGLMVAMHKEIKTQRMESPLSSGPKGMAGMVLGHLVYGVVVALTYNAYL